jgi:hypothetical protein
VQLISSTWAGRSRALSSQRYVHSRVVADATLLRRLVLFVSLVHQGFGGGGARCLELATALLHCLCREHDRRCDGRTEAVDEDVVPSSRGEELSNAAAQGRLRSPPRDEHVIGPAIALDIRRDRLHQGERRCPHGCQNPREREAYTDRAAGARVCFTAKRFCVDCAAPRTFT